MFPRLTTVFASRWNALWFAGMTMLLAYCSFGGDQPATPQDANADAADARAAIANSDMSAEDRKRANDTLNAIDAMGQN